MTNRELIRELAKPGKVYMPALTKHDVVYVAVEKAYLIDLLKQQDADGEAWWGFVGDGSYTAERWLDTNG
jgi:hypothetical protein